jgi:putative hydrolase
MSAGLLGADGVRALIASGSLDPADVVERIVSVLCLAMERVGRYAPTTLARPLEFLADAGVPETDVSESAIETLVEACRDTGTVVELSERHRMPTRRLARRLADAGVRMVASSDAYTARDVGRWHYLDELVDELALTRAS